MLNFPRFAGIRKRSEQRQLVRKRLRRGTQQYEQHHNPEHLSYLNTLGKKCNFGVQHRIAIFGLVMRVYIPALGVYHIVAMSNIEPDNLTPRARRALEFAREEAAKAGSDRVNSAHLLAGIVRLGSGVAWNFLSKLDVDLALVRESFSKVGPGSADDLAQLLSFGAQIASKAGHQYVGTEHLFLATVSIESFIGAQLLRSLGVENTTLRDEVLRELFPK
jgi:hypothetical protein